MVVLAEETSRRMFAPGVPHGLVIAEYVRDAALRRVQRPSYLIKGPRSEFRMCEPARYVIDVTCASRCRLSRPIGSILLRCLASVEKLLPFPHPLQTAERNVCGADGCLHRRRARNVRSGSRGLRSPKRPPTPSTRARPSSACTFRTGALALEDSGTRCVGSTTRKGDQGLPFPCRCPQVTWPRR